MISVIAGLLWVTFHEYTTNASLTVCSRPLDIGLIVDASSNIRGINFQRLRNFLKHIVASFSVSPRVTQFGMVEYNTKPRKLFDFNRFTSKATLMKVMGRIPFMNGKAKLGTALRFSAISLFSRSTRRKVAIVITGSRSLDSVIAPSRHLRRAGVTLVTVGIGRRFSVTQLRQIATTRRDVITSQFKTLGRIVRAIKERACKGEMRNDDTLFSGSSLYLFHLKKKQSRFFLMKQMKSTK